MFKSFKKSLLGIGIAIPFFLISSCTNDDQIGEIGISEIEVQVNPSGIAPLTALLNFETSKSARVTLIIPGKKPLIKEFSDLNRVHEIPVLGLYANTTNIVVVQLSDDSGNSSVDVVSIETGELPEYMPDIEIVEKKEELMEEGWNLLSMNIGLGAPNSFTSPVIFDQDGDIRWYLDFRSILPVGVCGPFEPLDNGNMICANQKTVREYNMLGFELNRWNLADNYSFHHDIVEKPNGNFIVAVDDSNLETVEDIAIEIDRNTGEEVNRWDLREILDTDRDAIIDNQVDWFHMNAIWYDEKEDATIFSGQRQGLVKVSNTNELIWILAPHKGWGNAGVDGSGHDTNQFLLTAVDEDGMPYEEEIQLGNIAIDDFEWVWGQHAPMILENGNLLVYDNGFGRNYGPPRGTYSRAVEYQVNETEMTVKQIWQVGKEKGSSFQSHIISDVDLMSTTGNRMVFSGINLDERKSHLLEVSYPNNVTAFEAIIRYKYAFVEDGAQLAPGNLDSSFRAERVSIYSGF